MSDNKDNKQDTTSKDIAKNIGNLSKEIIKALRNMSNTDPKSDPNNGKAKENMETFNTILSGSITSIITNLQNLPDIERHKVESVDFAKQAISKLVKMVPGQAINDEGLESLSKLGDLCGENGGLYGLISYISGLKLDKAKVTDVSTALGASKGVVKKIGDIITAANEIPGLDKKDTKISDQLLTVKSTLDDVRMGLDGFDPAVLAYFTSSAKTGTEAASPSQAMQIANSVKVAVAGSKSAFAKIIGEYVKIDGIKIPGTEGLTNLKAKVAEVHNLIQSNLLSNDGIIPTIFGDIEATRDLMQSIDEKVFDYFVDLMERANPGATAEKLVEKKFKQFSIENGNEKAEDITQYYIKSTSLFGQIINGIKMSLTAMKTISGPISTYVALFEKKGGLQTTAQIDDWYNNVSSIHDKMKLVIGTSGDKNTIVAKIVDDIQRFSEFEFNQPDAFVIPNGGAPKDSTFGQSMEQIKNSLKAVATVKTAIDSYVGVFAQKEKKKDETIVQQAKTSVEIIDGWVKSVTDVSDKMSDVFGETGVLKIILDMLADADSASAKWTIPESLKAPVDGEGNATGTSEFQNRINTVKSAINSVVKVKDIIISVIKTRNSIEASLKSDTGTFSESYKWLHKNILSDSNPLTAALGIVVDVDDMIMRITSEPKYDAIINKTKYSLKDPTQEDKEKGSIWGKEIGNALIALKGIQALAQIPKEVQKTKDKLNGMSKEIDVKTLIEEIRIQASDLFEQVSDGLIGIDEVVRNSNLSKITKETSDSITNTNAALQGISNMVQIVVDSGELMEKISYRRLVHASIQIEFFLEIITSILQDIDKASVQFVAQQSQMQETSKRIMKALEPIKNTFVSLNEIINVIINADKISTRKFKSRANALRKRIITSVAMLNKMIPTIAAEIGAITPTEKELADDIDRIMGPVKNILDLMKTIMEVKIPGKLILKYKIWILKSRIIYIAQAMDELNEEIAKIRGGKIDNTALRSVQASMNAVVSIVQAFDDAAKTCTKLLIRGKLVRPAIKLIIKQLDLFDKLTARINRMKNTHKANRKIRRMEELIRGVAMLAITMILLVPILALFIIASPILILGVVVFALTMKLIIKLIDFMINAKVGLVILELALVVMALIAIAILFIILATLTKPLLTGLPMICLMMLGILAFAGILALFGMVVSVMWPFMLVGLAGMAIVTIAVVCVLVIALALKLLETINLNPDAVLNNVRVVFDTAKEVMMLAFGPETDPRGPDQDTSFLDVIGGAIVNVIRALAASIILIYTVLSVAAILIIATLLRLLANYNVEKLQKGKTNAALTLGMAREVVDLLFGSDAPKSEESKDRGIFESLIDYVAKPLSSLLKAIFAVAYLAVMVVAIAMIMLLASQIRLLALFSPQELENGKNNAILTVQTAASIIAELFRGDDTDRTPSDRGGLLCVVGYLFGKEFEDIIRAVLSVAYLGVLILSTFLVMLLAKQIHEIGQLSPGTIAQGKANALLVVKTATEIMGSIFGAGDTDTGDEGGSWLKKILKWVLPKDLYFMIDAMLKIGKLALLVMAVGAIGKLAEQLTNLSKFNVNASTAKSKALMVINSAGSLVSNLKTMSNSVDVSEGDASDMYELCVSLEKLPGALVPIANNIMKLVAIKEDEINTSTANGLAVIRATRQMIEELNGFEYNDSGTRARLDIMDRISQTVGSFVKVTDSDVQNSKDITENYIKFFKQVDSMDLRKLQHTDYLMRSWASISRDLKGNFEGLAQTINQHIMPMLEKVNETLQKTTQCQQEIISELTKPVDFNAGGSGMPGSTPGTTPETGVSPNGSSDPSLGSADPGLTNPNVAPEHRNAGSYEHGKSKTPPTTGSTIDPGQLKKNKKYVVTFATVKEA